MRALAPEANQRVVQSFLKSLDVNCFEYYRSVMKPKGNGPTPPASPDAVFAALSDSTRRHILSRLASGAASVAELAEPFALSQPAISKHLKVLETAGLISRDRDAQRRLSRLEAKPLFEAAAWLEDFRRSTKPAAYVEDSVAGSKEKKKKKDKKTKHKKH
jgi:DNA-binding transcriptional ArsR family regulator